VDLASLGICLLGGAAGGNLAGLLMRDKSLGTIRNSLGGMLGGGVLGAVLHGIGVIDAASAAGGPGSLDVIGALVGGCAGGGVLTAILGALKAATASRA
jgi:hypothetical protein